MWVKFKTLGFVHESKIKILSHRRLTFVNKDGRRCKKTKFLVKYIEGYDEEVDGTVFDGIWEYIEPPTQDEIDLAKTAHHQRSEVHDCKNCSSKHLNMSKCSKCEKVRYCSIECQKEDWPTHQKDCKKNKKIKIQNPRYPLVNPDLNGAMNEKIVQDRMNDVLKDALA